MTRRTDLPWQVTDRVSYFGVRSVNGCGGAGDRRLVAACAKPHVDARANAEFIVKAVNNHDALVEALTEARLQLEYIHEKHGYATTEATLARIRYVLSPLSQERDHG